MNPHFVKYMLEEAGKKSGFNRTYRASIERVGGLSIPKIPISVQNEVMEKVNSYEIAIKKEKEKLLSLGRKRRIIENELIAFSL